MSFVLYCPLQEKCTKLEELFFNFTSYNSQFLKKVFFVLFFSAKITEAFLENQTEHMFELNTLFLAYINDFIVS